MKQEYDFSKGERGKFYSPDAEFHVPIYLDADITEFMSRLALQKERDLSELVNDLLRRDIELVQTVQ